MTQTTKHANGGTSLPKGMHRCAMHTQGKCDMVISDRMLMCGPHWAQVPRTLQTALWRAFRRAPKGEPLKSRAYLVAVRACVEAVLLQSEPTYGDGEQRMPI